ncbi:XdhC family protein [Altererythrobacter sp. MTPC7]|uniref:XdhC family protein n=1 Tax=Altererythrobacter sp. MTPC7 TaxID=3056567 RepID=UPI0036F38612
MSTLAAQRPRVADTHADSDHAALAAACEEGVALCTVAGIDGSFSRRAGAQLAVYPDGRTAGSLADRCLDRQLAADILELREPVLRRYGRGSDFIDFRLPCGGGLDIVLDPSPDRGACRRSMRDLEERRSATLPLPQVSPLSERRYLPGLAIRAFGEGAELEMLARLSDAMSIGIETFTPDDLMLGRASGLPPADPWTAAVFLFHDHEWELALIEEALEGSAFYIGAQGGENARIGRTVDLLARGVDEGSIARLRSPVGLIPSCKTPEALALSVLSEIVGEYEGLKDRMRDGA